MKLSKLEIILLSAILLLSFIIRVINLSADPLRFSSFIDAGDEGTHSYTARSLYLYNKWRNDGVSFGVIMPIFPPLQLLGLYAFGLHIYSFRIINVLLSTLTIILLFFFLKKKHGFLPSLVAVSALSYNILFLNFSRSGMPEVTMLFFATLCFIALNQVALPAKDTKSLAFVSFFIMSLALISFFTKQSSVALIPTAIFSIIHAIFFKNGEKYSTKTKFNLFLNSTLGLASAFLCAFFLYYFFIYLPHKDIFWIHFSAIIGGNRPHLSMLTPIGFAKQIKETLIGDWWRFIPLHSFVSILFLILIIKKLFSNAKLTLHFKTFLKNFFSALYYISTYELSLAILIFLVFFQNLFSPAHYGRFIFILFLPATCAMAFLLSQFQKQRLKNSFNTILKKTLLVVVIADFLIQFNYIAQHIIIKPSYKNLASAFKINKLIPTNTPSVLPVTWIMETRHKNLNLFLYPVSDKSFADYFKLYGYPSYYSVYTPYIKDIKELAPQFYKKLKRIKEINEYTIFKVYRF